MSVININLTEQTMYKSINQQFRPTVDVDFWSMSSNVAKEHLLHLKTNYIDTKKILSTSSSQSDCGLILTTEITWSDEKAFLEFQSDSIIVENVLDSMNGYAEKHGITIKVVDVANNMTLIQGPAPYPNLVIPDTWNNVEEFCNWWIKSGMPLCFPEDVEVFLSDDATAVCLFRKGRFQVELYLIHPNPIVPVHGHPGVEVIKLRLNSKKYPYLSETLRDGGMHGSGIRNQSEERGYPLLAIQHWITREPTTIASMWEGRTVGPKQEALIRRFNPNAILDQGWADTSANDA